MTRDLGDRAQQILAYLKSDATLSVNPLLTVGQVECLARILQSQEELLATIQAFLTDHDNGLVPDIKRLRTAVTYAQSKPRGR